MSWQRLLFLAALCCAGAAHGALAAHLQDKITIGALQMSDFRLMGDVENKGHYRSQVTFPSITRREVSLAKVGVLSTDEIVSAAIGAYHEQRLLVSFELKLEAAGSANGWEAARRAACRITASLFTASAPSAAEEAAGLCSSMPRDLWHSLHTVDAMPLTYLWSDKDRREVAAFGAVLQLSVEADRAIRIAPWLGAQRISSKWRPALRLEGLDSLHHTRVWRLERDAVTFEDTILMVQAEGPVEFSIQAPQNGSLSAYDFDVEDEALGEGDSREASLEAAAEKAEKEGEDEGEDEDEDEDEDEETLAVDSSITWLLRDVALNVSCPLINRSGCASRTMSAWDLEASGPLFTVVRRSAVQRGLHVDLVSEITFVTDMTSAQLALDKIADAATTTNASSSSGGPWWARKAHHDMMQSDSTGPRCQAAVLDMLNGYAVGENSAQHLPTDFFYHSFESWATEAVAPGPPSLLEAANNFSLPTGLVLTPILLRYQRPSNDGSSYSPPFAVDSVPIVYVRCSKYFWRRAPAIVLLDRSVQTLRVPVADASGK
jgi:hypothetical protein